MQILESNPYFWLSAHGSWLICTLSFSKKSCLTLHLSACDVNEHFLSSASKKKKRWRKNRWKTDPDADDATAAVTSLAIHAHVYLRLINSQQIGSSNIDTGLTKVTLWTCLWMWEIELRVGEAAQKPNNSVGSFVGLDRRKGKKNPDCSCTERSIRTRH